MNDFPLPAPFQSKTFCSNGSELLNLGTEQPHPGENNDSRRSQNGKKKKSLQGNNLDLGQMV
jgi:hypothetical protein